MSRNNLALVPGPVDVDCETQSPITRFPIDIQAAREFSKAICHEVELMKTVATLEVAKSVFQDLARGTRIQDIMTGYANIHAIGIGHLLHNASRKSLLVARDIEDMLDQVYQIESSAAAETQIGRHRFISRLRQAGLVAQGATDRHLKPAGTTPCFKSLRTLVSERKQLPFEEIISESRRRPVVKARFQAIWVMRAVCGHSLATIGQYMGNRDHTTVLNSINKVTINMQNDVAYRREVDLLCENADTIGIIQNRNLLIRSTGPSVA